MSLIDRLLGITRPFAPGLKGKKKSPTASGETDSQIENPIDEELVVAHEPLSAEEKKEILNNDTMSTPFSSLHQPTAHPSTSKKLHQDDAILEELIEWCRKESRVAGYRDGIRHGTPEFLQRGKEEIAQLFELEVQSTLNALQQTVDLISPELEAFRLVDLHTQAQRIEVRLDNLKRKMTALVDELLLAKEFKGMVSFRITDYTNGFRAGMMERFENL